MSVSHIERLITQNLPTFAVYRRQMQDNLKNRQRENDVYMESIRKLECSGVDLEDLLFFQQSDDYDATNPDLAYETHHIDTRDGELNKFKCRNIRNFELWMSVFLDVKSGSRLKRRVAVARFKNDVARIFICPSSVFSAEIDHRVCTDMRILTYKCLYNKKALETVLGIIGELEANIAKFIPPNFSPSEPDYMDEYEDNMGYTADPDERYDRYKRRKCGKPRFSDSAFA